MKVNIGWLNELVDLSDLSIFQIVDKLSLYSVEVEEFYKLVDIDNLVVGRVMIKEQHPNADKLSICTVNVGEEILQVVCGASNVSAGQDVIVAKVGAVLPGDFKIKKAKIRGVESVGMICSLAELGIEPKYISEEFQDGIYYFKEDVVIGEDPLKVLKLDDFILDLSITPDRGDLLSMVGMAYEMSALFDRPLKEFSFDLIQDGPNTNDFINVKINTDDCYTYYARVFDNLEIKESPTWLCSRLISFGIRPINNVVDITNYILALFGQPLHAFDYEKLGNNIVVRNAYNNEEVITLDNEKRVLHEQDVVITDGNRVVALGGVMGAANTEITADTTKIVLEAAVFNPLAIRYTSTRLNLRSESSIRFERGVDINRTKLALDYASFLLAELALATVYTSEAVAGIRNIEDKVVEISVRDLNKTLGTNIKKDEVLSVLDKLMIKTEVKSADLISCFVPSRRPDLIIKEDIYEEVIRILGYDLLKATLPKTNTIGKLTPNQIAKRKVEDLMISLGFDEVINYTLSSDENINEFNLYKIEEINFITLMKPLTEERKHIRVSLMPNLIDAVKYNFARRKVNIAFFEIGNIYFKEDEDNIERIHLAGAMANEYSYLYDGTKEVVDFYLIKGIVDLIFSHLGIDVSYQVPTKILNELHPYQCVDIVANNKTIGYLGALHPEYEKDNDIKNVFVFEANLTDLIDAEMKVKKYTPLSKSLDIERDIAVVLDRNVLVGDVIKTIYNVNKVITDVRVFDIYYGEKIKATEKSVAFKLTISSDKQLTEEDIAKYITQVVNTLEEKYQARLRD